MRFVLARALVLALAASPSIGAAQVPDHLQCFKIKDPSAKAQYFADLVPGDATVPVAPGCKVKVPAKLLCVDVEKQNVTPAPPGAPPAGAARRYLCYQTKCVKAPLAIPVADQFGARTVEAKSSSLLCAPVAEQSTTTTSTSTTTTTVLATGVVRFAALGNTGKDNAGQAAVAAALAARCAASGCDFVQLLGDNILDDGALSVSDAQWSSKFEVPYASIPVEFFAVLGNHDYGGNGAGTDFARGQVQIDYTAVSSKWRMPARHYHRVVQHVAFFALDSNSQLLSGSASFADEAAAQRTDVAAWLAASTASWKIAFGHHHYLSNGQHGNAGAYDGIPFPPLNGAGVKSFMDDVVCGRVDLHVAAHDRVLQWLEPTCQGTELVVSGGGGATTTALVGTNATRFQASQLGFLYVVVDGDTLTAEFVDVDGATLFSRSITKP